MKNKCCKAEKQSSKMSITKVLHLKKFLNNFFTSRKIFNLNLINLQ